MGINISSYHGSVLEPCKNVTIVVPLMCDNHAYMECYVEGTSWLR